jgi:integrase
MRTAIADGKWEPVVQRDANSEIVPNFKEFALRHISLQTNRRGELLRESTKSVYRRTLITHLKSFHSKPINLVSKAKIQEWYADLVATGKRTTASKAYKLLSAVMKRAADDGYISANPCSIRGAHSATTGKTVSIPTSAEVVSIANAIKPEFRNLVMLAAYGGFRFGRLVLHKGITCLDI